MKHVYDYQLADLNKLLAADKIHTSDDSLLGAAKIQPDKRNRTILIGLGGTGCKTIHYVKKAICAKLAPGWEKYVSFLAIDTAGVELDGMTLLEPEEKLRLTLPNVEQRAANPAAYPGNTWAVFADPEKVKHIPAFASEGAGRNRLMGKMKFHDKNLARGVDEEIISRLDKLKGNVLAPIPAGTSGQYEVYVVGSVSGGTCSGGFLEMPALIRQALNVENVHVYAMLYLPDTLAALDPANKADLEANGYAALKELNYFQGLHMRDGYSESWTCNDPANSVIKIDSSKTFFELPYLVGTRGGASADSSDRAMDTIAEFFISLLGQMTVLDGKTPFLTDSFLSNAKNHWGDKAIDAGKNPEKELPGTAHEFPKNFGAIGFASASAPQEILQAYTIGEACRAAGLQPVSAAERAALITDGITFLPFLGKQDYLTAPTGTATAAQLLKPLTEFLNRYQTQDFDMVASLGNKPVEWDDIYNGEYDDGVLEEQIRLHVKNKTQPTNLDKLDEQIRKAFADFRQNVRDYIEKEGPFAYVNLYEGHFIKENGNFGVGIKAMLERMMEGQDPATGKRNGWQSSEEAKEAVKQIRSEISQNGGLWKKLGNAFTGKRKEQAQSWKEAMDTWGNRLFNEKQRERVLGKHNALDKYFQQPAAVLAMQLEYFGNLLVELSEIYQRFGAKLNHYQDFEKVTDSPASVNIAAVNQNAHSWLKGQADLVTQTIEGKKIRGALIKSFFEEPESWMAFGDHVTKDTVAGVALTNPDVPIDARNTFETCMMKNIAMNVDISIENLFESIKTSVSYDVFAQQILTKLSHTSSLLFHGDVDGNLYHRYIMYPSALNTANPAIVTAIQNEAKTIYPGIGFYCSDYTDSIMMYQQAVPFEIYRLNDLEQWERNYDVKQPMHNGLHGRSPDLTKVMDAQKNVRYEENTSWYDYPSIVYRQDHSAVDNLGMYLYHEGEVRAKIDELLEDAKKLGVLYIQQDPAGQWYVNRVFCFNPTSWHFNETLVPADAKTGKMPTGLDLVKAVLAQNNKTLGQVSKTVELLDGGLMNQHHSTEEWAWYYAKRVLYAHRPMLAEIRETVKLFRKWTININKYNEELEQQLNAAKMIRIMQANVLSADSQGFWKLNGDIVANLSAAGLKMLSMKSPKEANLVKAGFVLYYLYKKLDGISLDPMLKKAQVAIEKWDGAGTIADSMELTEKMMQGETEKLEILGGELNEEPTQKFRDKLKELKIDPQEAEDILAFYNNVQMWDTL